MSKSRSKPLRGGVGGAPAGRGGMADQLFQAREGRPPLERFVDERMNEVDPTRQFTRGNRPLETFQTVGESLTDSMSVNAADNNVRKNLVSTVDAMIEVMREAERPLDPLDAGATANVVRAYSDAYRALPDHQKAVIGQIAQERVPGIDIEGFFGGASEQTRTPSSLIPGLREARATLADRVIQEADYYDGTGGAGKYYGNTRMGREQDRILGGLIQDYGLDPNDVGNVQFSDLALPSPNFKTFANRGDYPTAEQLHAYTGGSHPQYASNKRYPSDIDETRVAGEYGLLNDSEGEPYGFLPYAYNQDTGRPLPSRRYEGGGALITDNTDTDPIVALQMASKQKKILDEIHNRIWGFTESTPDFYAKQKGTRPRSQQPMPVGERIAVEKPLDLDYVAEWWRGETDQNVGGVIKKAPFTAEQITDTLLSQSGYGAEAPPYVRELAKARLLPQVEEAMRQAGPGRGESFTRTGKGMSLLRSEGAVEPPPAAPAGPSAEQVNRAIEALRRAGPRKQAGPNDLGMDAPLHLPQYARETMPNRMLSSLLT